MFPRTVILLVVACSLVWAEPAARKSTAGDLKKKLPADAVDGDRVAALFIKDSTAKGQLRFLGGVGTGSGTGSMNANINQLITNKQNMLEQLRPTTGNANNVVPIVITSNGGTGGTLTTATTGTSPTTTTVTGGGTGNGALQAAIQANPVAGMLPQVVAQAVGQSLVTRGRPGNRRRQPARRQGGNRRRVAANRRPAGNRKKGQQVYVIRPGRP